MMNKLKLNLKVPQQTIFCKTPEGQLIFAMCAVLLSIKKRLEIMQIRRYYSKVRGTISISSQIGLFCVIE